MKQKITHDPIPYDYNVFKPRWKKRGRNQAHKKGGGIQK